MYQYGSSLVHSDPQRWYWLGRAAARGESFSFLYNFREQVRKFNSRPAVVGAVVFAIGRALNGHVNAEKRSIFNDCDNFDYRIGPANQAIDFFIGQCYAARKAVNTWSLVGVRLCMVKDIRILIAKMIWDARDRVLYKLYGLPCLRR
jgi:hypothetical protein